MIDSQDCTLLGSAFLALTESELSVGVAVLDSDLRYVRVNQRFARLVGGSPEGICGAAPADVEFGIDPGLRGRVLAAVRSGKAYERADPMAVMPAFREFGLWFARFAPLHGPQGDLIGVLQTVTCSTGLAEKGPDGSQLLRRVIDRLGIFVGLLNPEGVLLQVNRMPLEDGGLSTEDVVGCKFWECYWFSGSGVTQAWVRNAVARATRGEIVRSDLDARMAADRPVRLDFMAAPLHGEGGEVEYLVVSALDITSRLVGEEALRESERRFRKVVESTPAGLAMVNDQGRIVLVNARACGMFGYADTDMVGMHIEQLMPERYRMQHGPLMRAGFRNPVARDMAGRRELFALRRDSSEFPVEIALNPVRTSDGNMMLATIVDVTVHRDAKMEVERALQEKITLLNEVHHRVKNNLQSVSSLLNLQAMHASAEARQALEESQRRVKSMALIHQLLYERNDFSDLHLGPYVQRLVGLLRDSFSRDRDRVRITAVGTETDALLDLQRSVPFGLLVTELVTNAVKHAFPDGRGGEVRVSLQREPAGTMLLTVQDNGTGLPVTAQLGEGNTLGMQLIPLLSEQAQAQLNYSNDGGARFDLHFAAKSGGQQ